jgi:hypothetical protein
VVGGIVWAITGNTTFFRNTPTIIFNSRLFSSKSGKAIITISIIALFANAYRNEFVRHLLALNDDVYKQCERDQNKNWENPIGTYRGFSSLRECVSTQNSIVIKRAQTEKRELAANQCKLDDTKRMEDILVKTLNGVDNQSTLEFIARNISNNGLKFLEIVDPIKKVKSLSFNIRTDCESEFAITVDFELPSNAVQSTKINTVLVTVKYPPTDINGKIPSGLQDLNLWFKNFAEERNIAERNRDEQIRQETIRQEREEEARKLAFQNKQIEEARLQVKLVNISFECSLQEFYPKECKSPIKFKFMLKNESKFTIEKIGLGYAIFPKTENCPKIISTKHEIGRKGSSSLKMDPGEVKSFEFYSESFAETPQLRTPKACMRITDINFATR